MEHRTDAEKDFDLLLKEAEHRKKNISAKNARKHLRDAGIYTSDNRVKEEYKMIILPSRRGLTKRSDEA